MENNRPTYIPGPRRSTNGAECGDHFPPPPARLSASHLSAQQSQEHPLLMQAKQNAKSILEDFPGYSTIPTIEKIRLFKETTQEQFSILLQDARAMDTPTALNNAGGLQSDAMGAQTEALKEQTEVMRSAVQVRAVPKEFTLDQLALSGLSLKTQKEIRGACPTLGSGSGVPARQDLSHMWTSVERALRTLGPQIEPERFTNAHIVHVAPMILGESVWAEFSHVSFVSWSSFKEAIGDRYGLSKTELLDAFYEMSPSPGESEAEFILRVEKMRVRYGESASACFRMFRGKLSMAFRQGIATAARAASLMNHGTRIDLDWGVLVRDATLQIQYSGLVPEASQNVITGFEPPPVQQPPEGVPAAIPKQKFGIHKTSECFASRDQPPISSTKSVGPAAKPTGEIDWSDSACPCGLCQLTGRANANSHSLGTCYANPKFKGHRPWNAQARLREIVKLELPIPECMKELYQKMYSGPTVGDKVDSKGPKQDPIKENKPPSQEKALLLLEDLETCLNDGMSASEAVHESLLVFNQSPAQDTPDPCPAFMAFSRHSEEYNEGSELQASNLESHPDYRKLQQYLSCLNQCMSNDDLIFADQEMSGGNSDSGSDSSDDKPISHMKKDASTVAVENAVQKALQAKKEFQEACKEYESVENADELNPYGYDIFHGKKKKASKKKLAEANLGLMMSKLKILLPLFKGMGLRPNLRKLIMTQAGLESFIHGDTIRLPRGTKVKEVSQDQIKDEIRAYSQSTIDEDVKKRLKAVRNKYLPNASGSGEKRDESNLLQELIGSVKELVEVYMPHDDSDSSSEDSSFSSDESSIDRVMLSSFQKLNTGGTKYHVKIPPGPKSLPSWVPKGVKNLRGVCEMSKAHYTGLCKLGDGIVEAMLDSGGARSMIDARTAETLGLKVERASGSKYFGCFYTASGTATPYAGLIRGPLTLQFSGRAIFTLSELKVIDYPAPLLLIGTDVLGGRAAGQVSFASLGINSVSSKGEIIFKDAGGDLESVELVMWPSATILQDKPVEPKRVTFAEKPQYEDRSNKKDYKKVVAAAQKAKKVLALARSQGQRL